jgi:hypothetical protein
MTSLDCQSASGTLGPKSEIWGLASVKNYGMDEKDVPAKAKRIP